MKTVIFRAFVISALVLSIPLLSFAQGEQLPEIDDIRVFNVGQREFSAMNFSAGVKEFGEIAKGLKTIGLGPCVGLVVYDHETQTGALAHLDAIAGQALTYNINSVFLLLSSRGGKFSFSRKAHSNISVQLVSGQADINFIERIKNYLEKFGVGSISEHLDSFGSYSIYLDLETGRLSKLKVNPQFYPRSEFDSLMMLASVMNPDPKLKFVLPRPHHRGNPCAILLGDG